MGALALIIGLAIAALLGFQRFQAAAKNVEPQYTTPFQAVQLIGGQVFYGRLSGANSPYPVIQNAYVITRQENPQTHEVTASLVRVSKSPNEPDRIILNARHIVLIEPVATDSQIGKAIAQDQAAH